MQRRFLPIVLLVLVLSSLLAACGPSSNPQSTCPSMNAQDAYGKPIKFSCTAPKRIITLIASESEIVAALGLDDRVVAVDAYTDYPADLTSKPRISSADQGYSTEQIIALKPDLVLSDGAITAKDPITQEPIDSTLTNAGLNLVDLPAAHTIEDVLRNITIVGALTLTQNKAQQVVASLQQRIDAVKHKAASAPNHPTVYMELDYSTPGSPYTFGPGSFGDDLIQTAGGSNIFGSLTAGGAFPQVTDEAIIKANPQVIILTEDPAYGGDPSQIARRTGWSVIAAVQQQRVYDLGPDLTSHSSPRLIDGLEALAKDLYPTLFA
jgi:iron complex transport system substrate-binding protein